MAGTRARKRTNDQAASREDQLGAGAVNIASHLESMAGRYPDKPAVIIARPWSDEVASGRDGTQAASVSFQELNDDARRLAGGFAELGIGKGTRTVVMIRPGRAFFGVVFALFRVGAVPVLIDPGMGARRMAACLVDIEPEAFIGLPAAHAFRQVFGASFRSVKAKAVVGGRWLGGGPTLEQVAAMGSPLESPVETSPSDDAAILFTSGSTGPAKGVLYAHGMFDAQVAYLNTEYGYGPQETDLATFPLFALFDAALGMTSIVPVMDFSRPGWVDPRNIVAAIERHGATHMFGSPALLDRVGRFGVRRGITLASLKRVITAGAPVPPSTLERWHKILPADAEVFTPYGASEALPVASIGSRQIVAETAALTAQGRGTCVGRPLAGVDVRIIAISEDPIATWDEARVLPQGGVGEVVVRGPAVTRAYYRKAAATAATKIADGDTFWHRMGDAGYLDDAGRLWFCGRKAHRVETKRETLFTVPCEGVFNTHPAVRRTALVGVGKRGSQQPVLCVEREAEAEWVDDAVLIEELKTLGRQHEHTREIKTFLLHPAFPVDVRHNAKISREKLAVWAARRLRVEVEG